MCLQLTELGREGGGGGGGGGGGKCTVESFTNSNSIQGPWTLVLYNYV